MVKKALPNRIKKRKYFLAATHNGRKFVAAGMVVQIVKNNTPDKMNVGFTTTKKLGCAVIRNRVRRRLREICRLEFLNAPKGYNYVFVGRMATIDRPFEALRKDARYILHQWQNELAQKNMPKKVKSGDGTILSEQLNEVQIDYSSSVLQAAQLSDTQIGSNGREG